MSPGMIILIVVSVLILFGVLQRVLDRMALTDRQALIIAAAMLIGGWLPEIRIGSVLVGIGGALIPAAVCLWLLVRADSLRERVRAVVSALLSALLIHWISRVFPANPESMPFEPMLLYGVVSGLTAWLIGRSRRSAFIGGILGILLADLASGLLVRLGGVDQTIVLGGAGMRDAVVLSGILAVLFCELWGEIVERIVRLRSRRHDPTVLSGGH